MDPGGMGGGMFPECWVPWWGFSLGLADLSRVPPTLSSPSVAGGRGSRHCGVLAWGVGWMENLKMQVVRSSQC